MFEAELVCFQLVQFLERQVYAGVVVQACVVHCDQLAERVDLVSLEFFASSRALLYRAQRR